MRLYKKTYLSLAFLAVLFLVFIPIFSIPVEALGPNAAVKKVQRKWASLVSFKANVILEKKNTLNEKRSIQGVLSYQNSKINLSLLDGRVIASNGIYMIAFNPQSGVAAKQLTEDSSGGLEWLSKDFSYTLTSAQSVVGKAINENNSIQEVIVKWDTQYLLQSLSILYRKNQNWLQISLSNVREVTSFSPSLFSYRPPTGSRTVEHALNRKD